MATFWEYNPFFTSALIWGSISYTSSGSIKYTPSIPRLIALSYISFNLITPLSSLTTLNDPILLKGTLNFSHKSSNSIFPIYSNPAITLLDVSEPSYTIEVLTNEISSAISNSFSITAIFKLYLDNS